MPKPTLALAGPPPTIEIPEVTVKKLRSTRKEMPWPKGSKISDSEAAEKIIRKLFKRGEIATQEIFVCLFLDQALKPIGYYKGFRGGVSSTIADIRLVFAAAINSLASQIFLCHNHPSGTLSPSDPDIHLTRKFKEAAQMMDMRIVDHIIVTEDGYYSFADQGLLGISKKSGKAKSIKMPDLAGFVTADQANKIKAPETFKLAGEMGKFLGELQRYMLAIKLEGESHAGKTQMAYQIADALIDQGYTVGALDYEQGGLESKDTRLTIERNVKPKSRKYLAVTGKIPEVDRLAQVKKFADKFDVILLDSWQSLKEITSQRFNELREEHPGTIFIVVFQKNAQGSTKGGASSHFDAPVAIDCHLVEEDFPKFNYAKLIKNRGNVLGKFYNIVQKKTHEGAPLLPEKKSESV